MAEDLSDGGTKLSTMDRHRQGASPDMPDSVTPHLISRRCALLNLEESSIISDFIKYIQCYARTILEQDQKRYFHIKASIQNPHSPAVFVDADVSDVSPLRIIKKKVQPNHILLSNISFVRLGVK